MASLRVHAQVFFHPHLPLNDAEWALNSLSGTSGQQHQRPSVRVRAGADGGVIDRPLVLPQWMKDSMSKKKRPPMYKVMLHNDEVNRRDYVVSVLLKVVEGLTPFMASKIMHEAHMSGIALVVACEQERAETYAQRLRSNGLTSTLEPN